MKRNRLLISLSLVVLFTANVSVTEAREADVSLSCGGHPAKAEAQQEKPAPSPGTATQNRRDGLTYVWIPQGTFMMGCSPGDRDCLPEEFPAHQVTITKGFWMGQTPVTVAAFGKFAAKTGVEMPVPPDFNAAWNHQEMPIVNVTWDDAAAFCGWAGGRLPTEAEWEYAARAGSTEARYGNLDEIAWYNLNSGKQTHDVTQKRPNAFKLYGMLGNVWEWVSDWNDETYYQYSPSQDPQGPERGVAAQKPDLPASGRARVLRGASWSNAAIFVRVSARFWGDPLLSYFDVGFRCGGEVFAP